MWKLINIYAQNLCAFKELDYQIGQGHTTLVFGNNMDDDSQVSNGSGKSALIEAIAVGLTGSTLRDIKMEEVINDAEDVAIVRLSLFNTLTEQTMTIIRTISRKEAQMVNLTILDVDGTLREEVQPTVADYNKTILDLIGLSKDDIFANFIISRHKYSSFLSCSDREKKEIINRFSNGNIVDESIAALQADMEPIKAQLADANSAVSVSKGRVSAIDEQIASAINDSKERLQKKSSRIAEWKDNIAKKRAYIREQNEIIEKGNKTIDIMDALANKMDALEKGEGSIESDYATITKIFEENHLKAIKNYTESIEQLHSQLNQKQEHKEKLNTILAEGRLAVAKAKQKFTSLQQDYNDIAAAYPAKYETITNKIQELLDTVQKLEDENAKLSSRNASISMNIDTVKSQLAGTITCPKCGHKFLLQTEKTIDELEVELDKLYASQKEMISKINYNKQTIQTVTSEGRSARNEQNDLNTKKAECSKSVTDAQAEVDDLSRSVSRSLSAQEIINGEIASIKKQVDSMRTDMFDEVFDTLDGVIKTAETEINNASVNVQTANGAITSYEESIAELENASDTDVIDTLKASKKKYEEELESAIAAQEKVQQELDKYQQQERAFTEFKTHLANTKIEALSHITNEFLEAIGSDIRIVLSGYTVLKSGKVRDKISITLIRDGVDGGSFNKYSEGEKSRVNLANILAMHKLTNVNCAEGKGLDLLVLDEILDTCDERGLSNMFQALNQLQLTSLVVSHGNIAEDYPHKLIINKQNGISYI